MSFDSKKTILLEKTYLYIRASLGFQLEGTSTEKIPTNNGFYRFFVDNLQKAIGNSYVNILYDSQDLTLQCFCSDLYMDELMSSDSSAIEDVVAELKKNTTTIIEFENGVSSALESNHQDNVALNAKLTEFESGVSSALAANHEDNVVNYTCVNNILNTLLKLMDTKAAYPDGVYSLNPLNLLCLHRRFLPSSFSIKITLNIDMFDICSDLSSSLVYDIDGLGYKSYKIFSPVPSVFSYSYNVRDFMVGMIDGRVSTKGNSFGANLNEVFTNNRTFSSNMFVPFYSFAISLDSLGTSILNAFSKSKKFALSCYDSSNKSLCLYSSIDGLGACLNQDFCYDFDGGYLNFSFYSPLDVSLLNQLKVKFITDQGSVTLDCSTLILKNDSIDPSHIVCTNFPLVNVSDCKKLLGVRFFS